MDTPNVVYQITNTITNEVYVGSTKRGFLWRKRRHLTALERGRHHNRHLQYAYEKYGRESFIFEIVEQVGDSSVLIDRETFWSKELGATYNIVKNIKSHIGCSRTEETKRKISKSLRGRTISTEHKEAIRRSMVGKKHTKERSQKIGDAHKIPIVQCDMNWTPVKEWPSSKDAADSLGLKVGKLYNCLNGRKKSHAGYRWMRKPT